MTLPRRHFRHQIYWNIRVLYHLSVSKRIRDNVRRLLTSLQAMWLDLRQRPYETRNKRKWENQVKKLFSRPRVVHKPQTIRSSNGRTRLLLEPDEMAG